jgi:hypothetical protein
MKTTMLSRDYPLQTRDYGCLFLEPIQSDSDDDDGGGGGGGGNSSSSGGAGIGGGGGGGSDCSSVGNKEGNTVTTQMAAIQKVGDGAAQHTMSSQAYTLSGMYMS